MLFLGSPDVNAEFHTLNFAADFGMLNLGMLKYFNVDYSILHLLTLKNKAENDLLNSLLV